MFNCARFDTNELDSLIQNNDVINFCHLIKKQFAQQPSFPFINYLGYHSSHNFKFFSMLIPALEMICVEKDPIDLCLVGLIFLFGFGISKDESKAFSLFQQGSEKNHPFSISLSGYCLANRKGVQTNLSEAIRNEI
jgi:hypothetical protein